MSTVTCNVSFDVSAADLGDVMAALGALRIRPDISVRQTEMPERSLSAAIDRQAVPLHIPHYDKAKFRDFTASELRNAADDDDKTAQTQPRPVVPSPEPSFEDILAELDRIRHTPGYLERSAADVTEEFMRFGIRD